MPANRPEFDRSLLIEGLGKGLRMIEAFTDDWPRMTATEAGRRTGLTRTAARRYLMSLVHFGYADTDGKHYWLLPSVLRLGQSYLEAARLLPARQDAVQAGLDLPVRVAQGVDGVVFGRCGSGSRCWARASGSPGSTGRSTAGSGAEVHLGIDAETLEIPAEQEVAGPGH